jgi:hypothetical protein
MSSCAPRWRKAEFLASPRVVQAWLTGVNRELGDRVPLRLLRDGDLNTVAPEIFGAARAF